MSTNRFSWMCFKKNPEKRIILENLLPEKYRYNISSFKVVQDCQISNETKFEAVVAVNVCIEEGIQQFLNEFQESSSTNYNMLNGDNKGGKRF